MYRGAVHGGRKITSTMKVTVEPTLKEYSFNVEADGEIARKTGAFVGGWNLVGDGQTSSAVSTSG
jgi:hypothetical protein